MPRLPARLAGALLLVAVGLRWIVNTNPWSGPTIVRLTATNGVHLNDWVSFVCWVAAALVAFPQWASTSMTTLPARRRRG